MSTVSALILSHNAAPFIAEAIQSALAQTHPVHEIIVVDDSTDDSPAIVERFANEHPSVVKLLRVEKCNVCRARNHALDAAMGDYLAFLDADDAWLPEKTAKQLAALRDDTAAVGSYSNYFDFQKTFDDLGRPIAKPGRDAPTVHDILFGQNVASSVTLFRRDLMSDLRFDEQATDAEDVIFAAELAMRGTWRLVDEPLIAKRVHPGQASRSHWHQVGNVRTRLEWTRRNIDRVGRDEAARIERDLGARLIQWLEGRYWRRQMTDLKAMCDEARAMFPDAFAQCFLSRARFYPRWVYRVRDMFSKA